MTAPRPGIVWYRDDLRVSDHPALHAAANAHAPVVCIYVLDDRAPGVRPLGGAARWWLAQSLRALQASLRERGASLVLRKGPAPKVIAALARETDAGSGVLERDRASAAPGRGRSGRRGARRDRCRRATLSRRPAGGAEPDPQQGEPRPARVHAVLAAGAGARRSAKAAAGAEEAGRRAGPRKRHARRLGARARPGRTGPAACAKAGSPARRRRRPGSRRSSTAASPAMPAIATGPTATAPRDSRRIFVSARSARARSGTPRALRRPSTLACPPISTNS